MSLTSSQRAVNNKFVELIKYKFNLLKIDRSNVQLQKPLFTGEHFRRKSVPNIKKHERSFLYIRKVDKHKKIYSY